MKNVSNRRKLLISGAILGMSVNLGHAAIIVNLSPTPTGALVTIVGSLDTSGSSPLFAGSNAILYTNGGTALISTSTNRNTGGTGYAGTGSGDLFPRLPSDGLYLGALSASVYGVFTNLAGDDFAVVPTFYTSGTPVDIRAEYRGLAFGGQGLDVGLSRTVTLPSGDFITFQTTPSNPSIPEPSSVLCLGTLLLAGLSRRTR